MNPTSPIERRSDRLPIFVKTRFRTSSWQVGDAALSDVSAEGCCLAMTRAVLKPGQTVAIRLSPEESLSGVVRWIDGAKAGVEFDQPLDGSAVEDLTLRHWANPEKLARLPLKSG